MSEARDLILEEVAQAAREWREANDAIPRKGAFSYARVDAAQVALYKALDAHEEIEKRQQTEATL